MSKKDLTAQESAGAVVSKRVEYWRQQLGTKWFDVEKVKSVVEGEDTNCAIRPMCRTIKFRMIKRTIVDKAC